MQPLLVKIAMSRLFAHGKHGMDYLMVLGFLLAFSAVIIECKYGFVVMKGNGVKIKVTDYFADIPDNHIARATYSNEINSTGWAFLEIHTSENCDDEQQAYAAGYLEGYLTRDLVWMHWQNMLKGYCYNKTDVCGLIEDFINHNEEFIDKQFQDQPSDPYWYQVKLYYSQIEGLADGYNKATTDPYEFLTSRDIVWINMLGDLDELALSLSSSNFTDDKLFDEHCTGLVKLLPDWSNLYFSHVTWNSYQSMLRIQKMYVMNLHLAPNEPQIIPGNKMSMSSYPGFIQDNLLSAMPAKRKFSTHYKNVKAKRSRNKITENEENLQAESEQHCYALYRVFGQSTDDFYIISSGLVLAETTIGNSNRTLFMKISPYGQIMEYARAMVANRLARNGKEWTEIFKRHNSGTYNNQWYIIDYKKFKPKTSRQKGVIKPGLLWVVEQLPGFTEAADLTRKFKICTYFPSYNIPYFPRVFALSGGHVRVATFGDWFGYSTNPRARMLFEKQQNIHNLRDMYYTMRYNDFKHDPLSRCEVCDPPYSACNAIAARNDLNPTNGSYPFRALGHRSHGATDAKITSAYLRTSYRFVAVSCPTHNISRGIPPFQWSKFDLGTRLSHVGHPDEWLFQPLLHDWEWE